MNGFQRAGIQRKVMFIGAIMDERQKTGLIELCGKGVRFDCPMNVYTTFRVGGSAEAVSHVRRSKDLQALLSFLNRKEIPSLVVGRGSNLLVRDGGIEGVVIMLEGELANVEVADAEEGKLLAGGGLTIMELLAFCKKNGWGGLEFLAGIPGTVGGAVTMNAGAWGEDVGSRVREVQMVDRFGKVLVMKHSELEFSYRRLSIPEGSVIFRVLFELAADDPKRITERIGTNLKRRRENQPLAYPSAGSVFKNPPGEHAGRLVEQAGLKGKRIGDAMISPHHANFIVNTGQARAKDILDLMETTRREILEKTGIALEPEIRIVGKEIP